MTTITGSDPMGNPVPGDEIDFGDVDFGNGDEWDAPTESGGVAKYFGLDYYRNKAQEFQQTLIALDMAASSAQRVADDIDAPTDLRYDLMTMLEEYEGKKSSFRLTAEAINAAASTINAFGGNFQSVQLPPGLGMVQFVLPAAAVAAFAAIGGLTYFAIQWIDGYNERLKRSQALEAASPESRDALAREIVASDNAVSLAKSSGLFGGASSIATIVKFGGLALAAWLAYSAWQKHSRND